MGGDIGAVPKRQGAAAALIAAALLSACGLRSGTLPATSVAGDPVDLLEGDARGAVVVFVAPDCPISNRYVPELNRLGRRLGELRIGLWVAYPDPTFAPEQLRAHLRDFAIEIPGLDDRDQVLRRRAGAEVTPEAVLFDRSGRLRYRGRIDDWYVDFGRYRPRPTTRDLEAAVDALLAGRSVPEPGGPAVGCYIPAPDGTG